jgi:hypothetical protein
MSNHEAVSVAPPVARFSGRNLALPSSYGAFVLALVGFTAVLITHLIDFGSNNLSIRLFNADSDASWSHVLIAAIIVVATAAAAVGAWRSQTQRGWWGAATAILGFIAIDEISSLHTRIDSMSWGKALYAPILLALCVCLWRLSAGRRASFVLRAGLLTLVISFAIHVFGPHVVSALGWGYDSWAYQVKVALKQGTELAGWLLVVWGLCRLVFGSVRSD